MRLLLKKKMNASRKLLLFKMKGLRTYILYNVALLTLAYFIDRFYQMLIFVLFYNMIQNCFNYRFHAETLQSDPVKAVKLCKVITIVVEIIYLIFCKDLDISVYSNLFIIFIITLINCLLELILEMNITKYAVLKDKDKLLELCLKANLSKNATDRMILKYIDGKTYQEIADIECVDIDAIRKSIARSRKKIFKG